MQALDYGLFEVVSAKQPLSIIINFLKYPLHALDYEWVANSMDCFFLRTYV